MIKLKFLTILITIVLTFNTNAAFDIKARTAILQDFLSGEILYEKDADKSIYPASMTKIMTAIIAFDLIKNGEKEKIKAFFSNFESILMQVAKTGAINKKTASRKISKISKKISN